MTDSSSASANFRTTRKQSSLRANVFLVECIVVLAIYGKLLGSAPKFRALVLWTYGVLYMIRLNAMARWLLPRELAVEEITFVILVWLPSILVSFSLSAAASVEELMGWELAFSASLYSAGSWLNTYSELQRKWWKARPENKGRCYTQGLFALSRNINYFGDVVLFAGWALATGAWWNAWVPLSMALLFYFHHIPDKEEYLSKRYERDWPGYVNETKAFIPFVC